MFNSYRTTVQLNLKRLHIRNTRYVVAGSTPSSTALFGRFLPGTFGCRAHGAEDHRLFGKHEDGVVPQPHGQAVHSKVPVHVQRVTGNNDGVIGECISAYNLESRR